MVAVVSTPSVVVTATLLAVDPIAPALVMFPWAWLEAAAPMSLAVMASDPPVAWVVLWAVGVLESDSRASLPMHTVELEEPVGILAIATVPVVRSLADPLVAIAASPDTAPDAIAIVVEPAAVSLPAASTVNVATLDAEP